MRARVVQHEVDHLDGVLYFDRMTDLTRLGFSEEILEAESHRRHLKRMEGGAASRLSSADAGNEDSG